MTDACPGWELEAEDHRVLGQLSRLTKAANGRISSGEPRRLSMRLHMDESTWRRHITELIHMDFVEEVDGLLYLEMRCSCEQAEGLPRVGAKERRTLHEGPVGGPGWSKPSPPRRGVPRKRQESVRAGGEHNTLSVGEGRGLQLPAKASTSLQTPYRAPDANTLQGFALPPRHAGGEQRAKSGNELAELRAEFVRKWNTSGVLDKVKVEATYVLDGRTGAFTKGLKSMKEAGITPQRILAMMDVFMAMVISGEVSVAGKPVWQVFLGKRKALLDRVNRDSMLGDARGEFRKAAVAQRKKLDALLDDE